MFNLTEVRLIYKKTKVNIVVTLICNVFLAQFFKDVPISRSVMFIIVIGYIEYNKNPVV